MTEPVAEPEPFLDESWLNDRSDYQRNFIHGLRNPAGLHLQYRVERVAGLAEAVPPGVMVVADWTADPDHMGFPGIAHGGLVAAILDDAIGRCAALRHRWVVTGRLEVRFRGAGPIGVPLRVEAWITRWLRRQVTGRARVLTHQGGVIAEAEGVYLPPGPELEATMVGSWPGMADYLGAQDPAPG